MNARKLVCTMNSSGSYIGSPPGAVLGFRSSFANRNGGAKVGGSVSTFSRYFLRFFGEER